MLQANQTHLSRSYSTIPCPNLGRIASMEDRVARARLSPCAEPASRQRGGLRACRRAIASGLATAVTASAGSTFAATVAASTMAPTFYCRSRYSQAARRARASAGGLDLAQFLLAPCDVVAGDRHRVLVLGHLHLEDERAVEAEGGLRGREKEFPHAAEALVIELRHLVALRQEALAPVLQAYRRSGAARSRCRW